MKSELELVLCLSQSEGGPAFRFSRTGAIAGSVEEAAHFALASWATVSEDVKSREFALWLEAVSPEAALAMEASLKRGANPVLAFVTALGSVSSYISREDEKRLARQIQDWETRVEWERLKEDGDSFMRAGLPDKALACYKAAMEKTRRAAILNNAGAACAAMGKYAQAALFLEEALSLEPTNAEICVNLATAELVTGNLARAAKTIEAFRALKPGAPEADALQGDLYRREGAYARACGSYESACDKDGAPAYAYKLALARRLNQEPKKALEALARVSKRDAMWHLQNSIAHEAAGNIGQAVSSIQEALNLEPSNGKILAQASKVALKANQLKIANDAAERALRAAPGDLSATLARAKALGAMGQRQAHQKYLEEAVERLKRISRDQVERDA
ncbi:MAG: tetratricopeptide repeat protein [Clostridiales bacterium]|jgi:tetratricopeptide (TPR) repeat protein|nr:tetratricopeptide repeat protein [Clostridiales bacterium]MDR2750414.1 tetratricopeptide repeat protein [Clostridiales bacterium]